MWNNKVSHVGIADELEDIQLLFDQRSEAKPILKLELATFPNYMRFFRHHSKSYLLSEEERTRQCHRRRLRQPHMNTRLGVHATSMESSSAPTQHEAPMAALPPD
ncbi:hypothetical protein Goarm_022137 [Gossypium armourianum]|uniref:Uncharacterized protein n=1 Tax=Gossypium armourianum TaxID=34283 RepID=A0A7J9KI88_9ROSI|nr:hypothetical protein [Gossypium armourianum]